MTLLPQEVRKYFSDSDQIHHFLYPLQSPPQQPKSIQLEKLGVFEGKLSGIKGQYLIFENDMVLNVRRHSGLYVSIEAEI